MVLKSTWSMIKIKPETSSLSIKLRRQKLLREEVYECDFYVDSYVFINLFQFVICIEVDISYFKAKKRHFPNYI